MTAYLRQEKDGSLALTIYVQPKASRDRITGLHGEAVKLSITAPPVEGKANLAVSRFLAGLFRLPASAVVLRSGRQSRTKKFLLHGLSLAEAQAILAKHLPEPASKHP